MMRLSFVLIGMTVLALAGCASAPDAANPAVAAKDDRCQTTGSNLPRRDCRGDVTVLPPSAVERVLPTGPGAGTGRP